MSRAGVEDLEGCFRHNVPIEARVADAFEPRRCDGDHHLPFYAREPTCSVFRGRVVAGPEAGARAVAGKVVHRLVPGIDRPDERLDVGARERRPGIETRNRRLFAEVVEAHDGDYSRANVT